MNIARTLGIFMALAALSFVLGFFVLARLMPGSPKTAMAATLPADTPPTDRRDAPAPAGSDLPSLDQSAPESAHGPASRHVTSVPGPTLDPVAEPTHPGGPVLVQKPRRLDESAAHSAPAASDGGATPIADGADLPKSGVRAAAAVPRTRRRRHALPPPDTSDVPGASDAAAAPDESGAADAQDEPVAKTRAPRRHGALVSSEQDPATDTPSRRRRTRPAPSDDPGTDGDGSVPRSTRRSEADAAGASPTVYRVHLGSFHSRDAADLEVRRARTKGFDTQVVPSTRNGRTIYRVQAGAYHERTRAESLKESLQDSSLDATVSEQRR